MESILTAAILKSLGDGDVKGFVAYSAIFLVLWLEVRGLRKTIKSLGESITSGFRAGETRFEKIEDQIKSFEHRLTVIEEK